MIVEFYCKCVPKKGGDERVNHEIIKSRICTKIVNSGSLQLPTTSS